MKPVAKLPKDSKVVPNKVVTSKSISFHNLIDTIPYAGRFVILIVIYVCLLFFGVKGGNAMYLRNVI
jgi:hypothetical protein